VAEARSFFDPYRSIRSLYLQFPIGFEVKRQVKDLCFAPISLLWPEAAFLKEWQAKRTFEQNRLRYAPLLGKVFGGEDEIKLHSLLTRWKELLIQSELERSKYLVPELKRQLSMTHLCKEGVPQVSIVLPCFGRAEYTLACLESLIRQETACHFEILIADDHRGDVQLSSYVSRLRARQIHYHHNATHLGFTCNVNQAALRAKGDFLVFLNNDTYCHPHWLERLVRTYRHLAPSISVGAIGSKVLHSNLSIQESGCLMLPGGMPHPLGRGAHCFDPRYSYLREVDFVSACSLLILRRHFLDCGGFDERFSPGYFEDPDLCERLRQRGLLTFVQPTSILLHEEGASFGKDGFSDIVSEKTALFNAIHPRPSTSKLGFEAKPRLLFIDAYLPMPDKGSGSVDAMAYLEYFLAKGYQPVLYAHHHNNYFEGYTHELEAIGVEVLQDNFQGLEDVLVERAATFQLVFVSRFYQMDHFLPLIRRYLPHAKVIYNTVDLHFLREGREADYAANSSADWIEELKANELRYIEQSDASIVISAFEYSLLKQQMPGVESIHHVPQCRPFVGTSSGHAERRGFVFIGSAHQPNVDALRFFHEKIHPCLIEHLPEYELVVIGKELFESLSVSKDAALLANPHVHFLGYIEDVTQLFDRAVGMVVPLRYGSGIKGKVVQSMQHALPCVTTTIGAEGLELPPLSSVTVADTPEGIADALHSLAVNPELWAESSSRAEGIFKARFSQSVFDQRLDTLMAQLHLAAGHQAPHFLA
jgi:O-antigen biosynthesis protein